MNDRQASPNPYAPPGGEIVLVSTVEDLAAFGWRIPPLGLGVTVVGYFAHAIDMFTWGPQAAPGFTVVAILLVLLYPFAAMRRLRSSTVALIAAVLQTLVMLWMLGAPIGQTDRVLIYNTVIIVFFVALASMYRAFNGWIWIRD